MEKRTFAVRGMTCAHCQAAVAKALKGVPGVSAAEVDLERNQAEVGFETDKVTVEALAKAVKEAGYQLLPA